MREGFVVVGAALVARGVLSYFSHRATTLVALTVAGQPALLAFVERALAAVLVLTVEDARIKEIHVVRDPLKLDFLRVQLTSTGAAETSRGPLANN